MKHHEVLVTSQSNAEDNGHRYRLAGLDERNRLPRGEIEFYETSQLAFARTSSVTHLRRATRRCTWHQPSTSETTGRGHTVEWGRRRQRAGALYSGAAAYERGRGP